MTTIAFRWGVMAADSRNMLGGWKTPYDVAKLYRLPDGTVAAAVGDFVRALTFIEWLINGEKGEAPTLEDASVIRMLKDDSLRIYENGGSFPVRTDYAAWGSGGPVANAAMHMGADAKKAIEVAALFDDGTGGTVVTMKCEV